MEKIGNVSRFVFAALLIVFGAEQFFNLDFLTAKVPEYFPLRIFWVCLTGIAMIITGASVFINKRARTASIALGTFLLVLNLLRYAPLFLSGTYNALLLTAAMLNLAITCGVFILARALPAEINLDDDRVMPLDMDESGTRAITRKLVELAKRENAAFIVHGHDAEQRARLKHAPQCYD